MSKLTFTVLAKVITNLSSSSEENIFEIVRGSGLLMPGPLKVFKAFYDRIVKEMAEARQALSKLKEEFSKLKKLDEEKTKLVDELTAEVEKLTPKVGDQAKEITRLQGTVRAKGLELIEQYRRVAMEKARRKVLETAIRFLQAHFDPTQTDSVWRSPSMPFSYLFKDRPSPP